MSSSSEVFAFQQLAPARPRMAAELDAEALAELREAALAESRVAAEAARAEAREEGYRDGMEAARHELQPALSALAAAVEQAAAERAQSADLLEREAVEMALQLAEKVLCGALEAQPERVAEVVEGTLRRVVERERVTVLVNPDDLELVRTSAESLSGTLGGIERLEIQGERRVARGGAVLRTAAGEVDARIAAQLERAREVVEAELRA